MSTRISQSINQSINHVFIDIMTKRIMLTKYKVGASKSL